MKPSQQLLVLLLSGTTALRGGGFFDTLDEKTRFDSDALGLHADLSFMTDATLFVPELPAQGLLTSDDQVFFVPRLITFFDVQMGDRLTLHTQMRADRGFDPGAAPDGEVRLDEYYLQARILKDDDLNVRVGKFGTAFGSWAKRSLSWNNPFVTAPMAYEDVLTVSDQRIPLSVNQFVHRRDVSDKKNLWLPILWGPSYATGLSVSDRIDWVEYALEVKNASISSSPEVWDAAQVGFPTNPTVTGRVGLHPAPEWSLGTSVSHGAYLQANTASSLPIGSSVNNFTQTTWGIDAGYEHGRWQIWSELIGTRFEVPRVGALEAVSGFIEAKYKLTADLWTAFRWNQAAFGDVPGLDLSWDRNGWRSDIALGWRLSENIQAKLQYSLGDKSGQEPEGNHLGALQLVMKF